MDAKVAMKDGDHRTLAQSMDVLYLQPELQVTIPRHIYFLTQLQDIFTKKTSLQAPNKRRYQPQIISPTPHR